VDFVTFGYATSHLILALLLMLLTDCSASTSSGRSDASDRVADLCRRTETAGGNATTDLSAFHSETKAPGLMEARGYVRATGMIRRGREK
jgi:hypothetical protein